MTTPYTRLRRVSVTRYNPETWTLQANILANGGTVSVASLAAVDAFVTACKNANIFSKLVDVGLFVGDQLAAGLVKLVYPAGGAAVMVNHGFAAGDYVERGAGAGLTNVGTKYLRLTTLANQTGAPGDNGNQSGALSVYAQPGLGGGVLIGAQTADPNLLTALTANPTNIAFTFGGGLNVVWNVIGTAGLLTGSAGQDQIGRVYHGAAQVAAGAIPAGFAGAADEFYVFADDQNNVGINSATGTASFYAVSQTLTALDVANLANAVQTLQAALNRIV